MIKRTQRRRKKRYAPKGSSRAKGDVLEHVVAEMHKKPGITVERNVFLETQDGRSREIDVLITSHATGYPVNLAIECKNWKKKIGSKEIDSFVGKLQDVGIPSNLGIYVVSSGYTEDAMRRAHEAGVTALVLEDVSEKLFSIINNAAQFVVHLLLTITGIEVVNDIDDRADWVEIFYFFNAEGRVCGSIMDLVWKKWMTGEVPFQLGEYQFDLDLPDSCQQIINGKKANIERITVSTKITGHMIVFPGHVSARALRDAQSQEITRKHIEAIFNASPGTYETRTFEKEDELHRFINHQDIDIQAITRLRFPRILFGPIYWPPSEKAIKKLLLLKDKARQQGEDFNFQSLTVNEIEGSDLRVIWDEVIRNHPDANLLAASPFISIHAKMSNNAIQYMLGNSP